MIIYINLINTILIHKQFNPSMMQDLCNQFKYLKHPVEEFDYNFIYYILTINYSMLCE